MGGGRWEGYRPESQWALWEEIWISCWQRANTASQLPSLTEEAHPRPTPTPDRFPPPTPPISPPALFLIYFYFFPPPISIHYSLVSDQTSQFSFLRKGFSKSNLAISSHNPQVCSLDLTPDKEGWNTISFSWTSIHVHYNDINHYMAPVAKYFRSRIQ